MSRSKSKRTHYTVYIIQHQINQWPWFDLQLSHLYIQLHESFNFDNLHKIVLLVYFGNNLRFYDFYCQQRFQIDAFSVKIR